MYKIYINENRLTLAEKGNLDRSDKVSGVLVAPYSGKNKMLLNYVDMLEKTQRIKDLVIYSPNLDTLKTDFKDMFITIKAAGGLVVNPSGQILFIKRRGYWDLPKGKLEKGEKKKDAAIREVIEETGIKTVELKQKLIKTRHAFRKKDQRAIKLTHWYLMHGEDYSLVPQAEEEIEDAIWMDIGDERLTKEPIFNNIIDVLSAYKELEETK